MKRIVIHPTFVKTNKQNVYVYCGIVSYDDQGCGSGSTFYSQCGSGSGSFLNADPDPA